MLLNLRRFGALGLLLALAACPTPVGTPVAVAGPDQPNIAVGTVVQLDGSGSMSPQGRPLTFTWQFTALPQGSHAALNDVHSETPSFTADAHGTFTIQLVVSNAYLSSSPSLVNVIVTQCGANAPTTGTLASTPATPGVGTVVTVSAPQADDLDNDHACGLTQAENYEWELNSQPPGSSAALNNANAVAPSFTADIAGSYGVRLIITDSTGLASTPADLTITVAACGSNAPVIGSITPTIQQPGIGQQVQFTPQVSDADNTPPPGCNLGQTFSYAWTTVALPTGSAATLNSTSSSNPSFTPDVLGTYEFQLVVTDSTGRASLPATVSVTSSNCGGNAPTAAISFTPAHPEIGSSIQLGASVSDLDNAPPPGCDLGQTFTYAWSLRAQPAGSTAHLNNPTAENPTFVADVSGSYVVELVVTDSTGLKSAPIDIAPAIVVTSCGNAPPVITEIDGPAAPPNPGDTVTFTATVTDADNLAGCALGQTYTNAWSFAQRPSGSAAFILDPTSLTGAQFVVDKPGTYQVELIATDSTGLSSAPKFQSTTATDCGLNAPMIVSTSETPNGGAADSAPNPGQSVALVATWTDPDNSSACNPATPQSSYVTWTVIARPPTSAAALQTPVTAATSTGTAPATAFVPDVPGTYQFAAVATDSTGLSSAPSFITFTATNCGANAPTVSVAQSVYGAATPFVALPLLTATANDADNGGSCNLNQTVTCLWTIAQHPASSASVFPDPTRCDQAPVTGTSGYAGFAPDVPGLYQLSVVATDSTGLSSKPATVTVQVASDCGSAAPSVGTLSAYQGSPSNIIGGTTVGQSVNLQTAGITPHNCNPVLNGLAFTYRWSIVTAPNGSQAVLSDPTVSTPSVTFDKAGSYQFSLVVTNALGIASDPAFVTITAGPCGLAPLSFGSTPISTTYSDPDPNFNPPATPFSGSYVTLSANFTDPNGNVAHCGAGVPLTPDTYQWQIVSAPTGSRAQLTSSTAASPTFVPDVQGAYQVSVVVTDALGNSTPTAFLTVTVSPCGADAPTISSLLGPASPTGGSPTASSPITINANVTASLLATASAPDNTGCPARFATSNYTYAWNLTQQPVGGNATLGISTGQTDSFVASVATTGSPTNYQVSVVATSVQSGLASPPATMNINVTNCGSASPVINGFSLTDSGGNVISHPVAQGAGGMVTDHLIVTATDSDNSPSPGCALGQGLTFHWTLVSAPVGSAAAAPAAGSAIAPNGSTGVTTTNVPVLFDVAGSYEYAVVAVDPTGLASAPAEITVTTAPCAPVVAGITVSPAASNTEGKTVTLTAGAITDACTVSPAGSYTYNWSIISKPAGSTAILNSPLASSTTFTPDVIGNFVVALQVTDIAGFTSTAATTTIGSTTCVAAGVPVPAGPTASFTGTLYTGGVVSLTTGTITDTTNATACGAVQVTPFTYAWSILAAPQGSRANLSGTSIAAPIFVPDVAGTYQIGLIVTDAVGASSVLKTTTVTTSFCGAQAPIPSIVVPGTIDSNVPVSLTSSVTYTDTTCPAQFNATHSYSWSISTIPANAHASLSSTNTSTVTFTGVDNVSTAAQFDVSLTVTDSTGLSGTTTSPATVQNCGAIAPVLGALSTLPATTTQNTAVTIDLASLANGNTACAINDTPVLAWSLTQRPPTSTAQLNNPSSIVTGGGSGSPIFTPDQAGLYVVSVTATDAHGNTTSKTLNINAGPDSLTLVNPQGSQTVQLNGGGTSTRNTTSNVDVGYPIQLSIAAQHPSGTTICPGSGTCSYAWSLTSLPQGSAATFNSTSAASPSFTPDVANASWTAHVVITSSSANASGSADIVVSTGPCGGNSPMPTIALTQPNAVAAAAPLAASVAAGSTVQLLGAANDADTGSGCNLASTETYAWTLTAAPTGSHAALSSSSALNPTFVADVSGSYSLALLVTDSTGRTGLAGATITATGGATQLSASALPFTALAIDPTTNNPVSAALETANGGTVVVYQCTNHCTGGSLQAPQFNRLVVDTNVGVPTWTELAEPKPVDVRVSSTGQIFVLYHAVSAADPSGPFPARTACGVSLASYQAGSWTYTDLTTTFYAADAGSPNCSTDGSVTGEVGRYLALTIDASDHLAAAAIVHDVTGGQESARYSACIGDSCANASATTQGTMWPRMPDDVNVLTTGSTVPALAISSATNEVDVVVTTNDFTNATNADGSPYPASAATQPVLYVFPADPTGPIMPSKIGGTVVGEDQAPIGNTGFYPSITPIEPNTPINLITYYDVANGQSKATSCSGPNGICATSFAVVDPGNGDDVGRFSSVSLTVGSTVIASVAYLDETLGTVKVAKSTDEAAPPVSYTPTTVAQNATSSVLQVWNGQVFVVYGTEAGGLAFYVGPQ